MQSGFFSPDPVSAANLAALAQEDLSLAERRICELAPIADEMAEQTVALHRDGMDLYGCLSLIGEYASLDPADLSADAADLPGLSARIRLLSLSDRISLCGLYLEKLAASSLRVTECDFLPEDDASELICYLRNPLSDEAYDVLSQWFSDPRVRYVGTPAEACRAVAEGKCGFCLLPLEEHGTRLHAIAALLFRFDLKIDGVTPVFGFDGSADMRYALVGRAFRVPSVRPDDDRYFELRLRFDPNDSSLLSDLFFAAVSFGYSVYRVNTQTARGEEGEETFCSLVFRDEGKDFLPLLIYLTLFFPDFVPVGIYGNLE